MGGSCGGSERTRRISLGGWRALSYPTIDFDEAGNFKSSMFYSVLIVKVTGSSNEYFYNRHGCGFLRFKPY